ncbi:hypothetical protein MMC09_005456 [Bachmanniomyces sp. S44760]|nr:hypothetical protein [Bachmanniomyces sp. S44760]
MATAANPPAAPQSVIASQSGVPLPPTPQKIQSKIDLAITLTLHLHFPALTLAVQNSWGGPSPMSAQKRDWFAGAISDLFATTSESTLDVEYVEEFLLQVMSDEFEVEVDDGSVETTAARLIGLRKECLRGNFRKVDEMWQEYRRRREGKEGANVGGLYVQGEEVDQDTDGESVDGEDQEDDGDVAMGDTVVETEKIRKERIEPEVDEEGFTKVVGRKKR